MLTDLPPIDRTALLLDVDGTLLDFAPAPMAAVVPPGLCDALRDLKHRLGGALGMISGRPVEQVAALFGDVPYAIAGEHGGALRRAPGEPIERPALPMVPADWLVQAERLAKDHPGVLLERKTHGFALHYRNAPEAGIALQDALAATLAGATGFDLMPAHMTWEVRPRGADKGTALKALMQHAPFVNRIPVFIGDDVTDEDAIRAARVMGGVGLMVADEFGRPADVRAWIAHAAQHGW